MKFIKQLFYFVGNNFNNSKSKREGAVGCWTVRCRASDNSREKKSNFAGFLKTNSRRKRPISREFRGNFRGKESQEERFQKKKRYTGRISCCFAVYKAGLFVIEGLNPFVKSKHCCVFNRLFDRALHVRLNMCLHYYRQQFPFPLRIVSPKSLLISCAHFFATLI